MLKLNKSYVMLLRPIIMERKTDKVSYRAGDHRE